MSNSTAKTDGFLPELSKIPKLARAVATGDPTGWMKKVRPSAGFVSPLLGLMMNFTVVSKSTCAPCCQNWMGLDYTARPARCINGLPESSVLIKRSEVESDGKWASPCNSRSVGSGPPLKSYWKEVHCDHAVLAVARSKAM